MLIGLVGTIEVSYHNPRTQGDGNSGCHTFVASLTGRQFHRFCTQTLDLQVVHMLKWIHALLHAHVKSAVSLDEDKPGSCRVQTHYQHGIINTRLSCRLMMPLDYLMFGVPGGAVVFAIRGRRAHT